MKRSVLIWLVVGTALPVVWFALYHLLPGFDDWWFKTPAWTGGLLLAAWPSSLLMLGDPQDKSLLLPLIATVLNAAFYSLLGALLWIGLYRSKAVLFFTVAALSLGWYGLLTLYY